MNIFQLIIAIYLETQIINKTADKPWICLILPTVLFIIQLIPVRKEPGVE